MDSTTTRQDIFGVFKILLPVSIVAFIIWYLQWHWSRRRLYEKAAKINGPPSLPIIGSALLLIGSTRKFLLKGGKYMSLYKSPFKFWLGHRLLFIVTDHKDYEVILNSPNALKKDDMYRYVENFVGLGLFSAPVPEWKRHRKIIMPTFNQKILNSFVDIFVEQSEILVEMLKKEVNKGDFDIFHYVCFCTLDIICETAMGLKVNAQTTEVKYVKMLNRAMEIVYKRMFNIWYHFDFIFNFSPMAKETEEIKTFFHNFSGTVVKAKREAYAKKMQEAKTKPEAQIDENEVEVSKRKVFLDHLIELSEDGDKFTDEELRDEVNTFMIAGSDTTAITNSFVFIMLGMHPEVQEKVYQEILDIFEDSDRPVTVDDLPKMKYTERVIKETMRIFPVGPVIVRSITEDIELDTCTLPKGSSAVLSILFTHRNPKIWPNPLCFDPDRFTPEEMAKRHPYSFIPFSGGPRNCIGLKYAMMSMKALICTVVRNYKFGTEYTKTTDIKLKVDLVLKPVKGFKVNVTARKTNLKINN